MNVTTEPATDQHCVRNVYVQAGTLAWDAAGISHALVISGAYNEPLAIDGAVRDALEASGTDLLRSSGAPVTLSDGRTMALLMRGAIRSDAYSCSQRHARYAVFGCRYDAASETLSVFVPAEGDQAACDVPGVVRVDVRPHWETRKSGFLGRKQDRVLVAYELTLQMEGSLRAGEGLDLWYEFEGCAFRYPVTSEMLGKSLYVRPYRSGPDSAPVEPVVKSGGHGFEVVTA